MNCQLLYDYDIDLFIQYISSICVSLSWVSGQIKCLMVYSANLPDQVKPVAQTCHVSTNWERPAPPNPPSSPNKGWRTSCVFPKMYVYLLHKLLVCQKAWVLQMRSEAYKYIDYICIYIYITALKNRVLGKQGWQCQITQLQMGKASIMPPLQQKTTKTTNRFAVLLIHITCSITFWNKWTTMIHHLMSIEVAISFPNHTSFRTSTIEVAGFQPWDARIRPQRQANMPIWIKASHLWWTWAFFQNLNLTNRHNILQ